MGGRGLWLQCSRMRGQLEHISLDEQLPLGLRFSIYSWIIEWCSQSHSSTKSPAAFHHPDCRQEAQAAREQLQARVTILEGRVRFLEAGFELRPPHHTQQQPLLLPGSTYALAQPQPPLALPAPAPAGVVAAHAAGGSFGGSSSSSFASGMEAVGWRAPAPAAASSTPWQTSQLGHTPPASSLQQHARVNPLFESQQQAAAPATLVVPGCTHAAIAAPAAASAGAGSAACQHTGHPVPQQGMQPPPQLLPQLPPASLPPGEARAAPAAAAPATTSLGSGGSAADLIRSMQARFSEAEDFLLSLRRL